MVENPFQQRLQEKENILQSKNPFETRSKEKKSFESQYQTSEETEKDIERAQAQFTSRGLEAVAGLPGDLVNFVGGLFGFEPGAPGSQELRQFSEDLSQGYTSPQNDLEEKVGETLQDMTLFALPGAKHYSFARNIGIPIVANLAKEGVKYLSPGEKKESAAKVGSMVVLDLLSHRRNLGTAKEFASSLFQKADEAIPKGLSIKASNLKSSIGNLEKSLEKGGSRPDTAEALQKIKEIREEITDKGFIDLKNLVAYRPSINSWIDKFKGFDVQVPDKIRRKIIHNLQDVKREVIKAAEEYGEKYNPEYLNLSRSANEAYAAIEGSNKIANFIQKTASSKIKSKFLQSLLGLTAAGSLGGASSLGGLTLGGTAGIGSALAYKAFKTILRSKSPTLRKHYFDILEGASKGNTPQVLHNVKFLDDIFKEMEKTGELSQEA